MERKYYLRGLGIGIAVTAIIMGIALSGDKTMTNDEIIARAKELGMVENTVLSDTDNEDTAQEDAGDNQADDLDVAVQPQSTPESVQNDPEKVEDTVVDNEADAETDIETDIGAEGQEEQAEDDEKPDQGNQLTADDSETGDDSEPAKDTEAEDDNRENAGGTVTAATVKVITINSGDSSYTVAKKLADVGVVTSAATYDTFLCQNGYDKSLRTGTFSIPADASDEQIARIVTGRE